MLQTKTKNMIERSLLFKKSQDKLAREMGFEYSSESFIKGDRNIVLLLDIGGLGEVNGEPVDPKHDENFKLFILFEMEQPIKCELFDCDQFVVTIDDIVV